ncbi:MAG: hypothetical protein U9R42_10905, partial [Bacteroidota bacterium]|nr:hypothetical protein [Bacteroidota bacterium]
MLVIRKVYTDPPVRTGDTRKEIFAMRIDTTGDTVWTFQYGRDSYNEIGYSVVNNGNDNFIILRNSTPIGSGDAKIRVIKIGADDSSWNNLYGATNYDIEAYKIINDYGGNYIIAANDVTDDINPKLYLIEDSVGRLLNTYDYNLNDDTKIFSIDTAFDKGYIVAGYGICNNDTDGFVMKLDTAFEQ